MEAGSLSGTFANVSAIGVPADHTLVSFEASDGVYLKLLESRSFADWTSDHGLLEGEDGPNDDPDHDAIPNGFEMLLGTDPNTPDAGPLPPIETIEIDGVKYLSVSIALGTSPWPENLSLSAKRSTNLEKWTTEGVVEMQPEHDVDLCTQILRWRSEVPLGSLPREFLRLELQLTTPQF